MSSITLIAASVTADSSNVASYTTPSFTPTAGRLLVVTTHIKATVVALGVTASANSITFTTSDGIEVLSDAGGSKQGIFPAGQLTPASPVAMTITVTCTGDAGTGATIGVYEVDGMTNAGAAAVLQKAGSDNNLTASSTPTLTFASAPQTANPVIAQVGNNTNPAGLTPPTGFSEPVDSGFTLPTTGTEVVTINSGSPTTLTWGSTSTRGAVIGLEFDTSGGVTNLNGTASSSSTDTISTGGVVGAVTGAALAATVALTATGVVGAQTGASINGTDTITAAGSVAGSGLNGTASLSATDSTTTAGVVGAQTGSSLAATDTITAAGVVARSTGATYSGTATVTATGVLGLRLGSSLAATDTITAAGTVATSSGATLAATGTITASAGSAALGAGASSSSTVTVTAAGVVGKVSGAAVSATDTLNAAGVKATNAGATVGATGTVTAAGTVARSSGATLTSSAAITADGQNDAILTIEDVQVTLTAAQLPRQVIAQTFTRTLIAEAPSRTLGGGTSYDRTLGGA